MVLFAVGMVGLLVWYCLGILPRYVTASGASPAVTAEQSTSLAAKLHSTKSDVLRKAVALLEVAVRAKEEHKKFGVAAPDQTLETEIVGI